MYHYGLKSNITMFTEDQKKTARYMKAMSHPVRIYILELLSNQTCCYSGDLAESLSIAPSTLSQHLKELKNAGLIQGEINPPKIKYCLNHENWAIAWQLCRKLYKADSAEKQERGTLETKIDDTIC
jgi:DNA-binding transcriptional ArsR family regulator